MAFGDILGIFIQSVGILWGILHIFWPVELRKVVIEREITGDFWVASGKLRFNYGKSPFSIGKPTNSMAIFHVANCWFTRG